MWVSYRFNFCCWVVQFHVLFTFQSQNGKHKVRIKLNHAIALFFFNKILILTLFYTQNNLSNPYTSLPWKLLFSIVETLEDWVFIVQEQASVLIGTYCGPLEVGCLALFILLILPSCSHLVQFCNRYGATVKTSMIVHSLAMTFFQERQMINLPSSTSN